MTRRDNWPWRFHQVALTAGYEWRSQEIGVALRGIVEQHSLPLVERAFNGWVRCVARVARSPYEITLRRFASKVGYWIHMSAPWQP